MDADRRIDAQLALAMDELLTLASLCAIHGRPELALAASAALDRLLGFGAAPTDLPGGDPLPDLPGGERHAQH